MKSEELKKYFLGLLSAEDAESLELRIISDDGISEKLLQTENDLIEDYLDGNLANAEIQAFNRHFLITDERRERVEFVRLVRNYADKKASENETKTSFFEQLKAFVSLRPIVFAAASLGLILIIGIIWQIVFRSNVNVANTELAAINKQDLSNLGEFKNLKNLSLSSVSTRSGEDANRLSEKDLTEKTLVRLILPNKTDSIQNFSVKISQNGKLLQTLTQRTYNQEVRLILPKTMLAKGEYQILLEKDGEKYNYYFAVE
jgi:hypothetical protein